jgi:hypothetical protein
MHYSPSPAPYNKPSKSTSIPPALGYIMVGLFLFSFISVLINKTDYVIYSFSAFFILFIPTAIYSIFKSIKVQKEFKRLAFQHGFTREKLSGGKVQRYSKNDVGFEIKRVKSGDNTVTHYYVFRKMTTSGTDFNLRRKGSVGGKMVQKLVELASSMNGQRIVTFNSSLDERYFFMLPKSAAASVDLPFRGWINKVDPIFENLNIEELIRKDSLFFMEIKDPPFGEGAQKSLTYFEQHIQSFSQVPLPPA